MSKTKIPAPFPAPRLEDVAAEVGVSRVAVARVMLGTGAGTVRVSEETSARIRDAAARLGYRPNRLAQQLKGKRSGMIGVLLDSDNPDVMNDRLFSLEEEAGHRGCRLLIGRVRGNAALLKNYIHDFEERNTDGILCLFDLTPSRTRMLRGMARVPMRMVFHGRSPLPGGKVVRVDTAAAVRLLFGHLAGRGRKRIALALSNRNDALVSLRKRAYLEARSEMGLPEEDQLIWSGGGASIGPEEAARAVEVLVGKHRADALIATDDIMAAHLIRALHRAGCAVPGDVAVTGYDNLRLGLVTDPRLTTIDQHHDLYAKAVMDLLGTTGEPGGQVLEKVIPPELVVRESA